jgi:hypothetical protein
MNKKNANFFINDLINYIVFDMFRMTKCSSSGILVHAVLWHLLMYPNKQFGRYQDVFDTPTSWRRPDCLYYAWQNTTNLHVQVLLRMKTWSFETYRKKYNWTKSLVKKVCILLVLIRHVYLTTNWSEWLIDRMFLVHLVDSWLRTILHQWTRFRPRHRFGPEPDTDPDPVLPN